MIPKKSHLFILSSPCVLLGWGTFLIAWWIRNAGRNLTFVRFERFLMLRWGSVFIALLQKKGKLTLWSKPLGRWSRQLHGIKRRHKNQMCLGIWLNYLTTPLQDKLKGRSHCGPWTSQINRITEKEWLFLMEKSHDPPPFFPCWNIKRIHQRNVCSSRKHHQTCTKIGHLIRSLNKLVIYQLS